MEQLSLADAMSTTCINNCLDEAEMTAASQTCFTDSQLSLAMADIDPDSPRPLRDPNAPSCPGFSDSCMKTFSPTRDSKDVLDSDGKWLKETCQQQWGTSFIVEDSSSSINSGPPSQTEAASSAGDDPAGPPSQMEAIEPPPPPPGPPPQTAAAPPPPPPQKRKMQEVDSCPSSSSRPLKCARTWMLWPLTEQDEIQQSEQCSKCIDLGLPHSAQMLALKYPWPTAANVATLSKKEVLNLLEVSAIHDLKEVPIADIVGTLRESWYAARKSIRKC